MSYSGRRATLSGSAGVWILTAAVLVSAGIATAPLAGSDAIDGPFSVPWWALVLGFAAAEIFVIHFQFRQEQFTFSLMELPLVLGMFLASPITVILARLVGGGFALRVHRRQAPMKLIFNLATHWLETATALLIF